MQTLYDRIVLDCYPKTFLNMPKPPWRYSYFEGLEAIDQSYKLAKSTHTTDVIKYFQKTVQDDRS